MKTLLSLIVFTTLVAQLPQLQAAPSDFNSELIAALRKILEIEEAKTQSGKGFYSTSCDNFIQDDVIVGFLNGLYAPQFQVEFRCGHPTSSCTRVTDYKGASYQRYFELCDQAGKVCSYGSAKMIQIGSCNNRQHTLHVHGPYTIDGIPVGSKKTSVEVSFSGDNSQFECIQVEFKGPKC